MVVSGLEFGGPSASMIVADIANCACCGNGCGAVCMLVWHPVSGFWDAICRDCAVATLTAALAEIRSDTAT